MAARIQASVDGTPGANDMPGRLMFSTTADGASTPTERMRIDSSGRVGIGSSSPSAKLHVSGAYNQEGLKIFSGASGYTSPLIVGNSSGTEYMRIDSSGNVGIGTSSPGSFNSSFNNLVVGSGSGNEGITVYTGNVDAGFLAFSDTADTSVKGLIEYNHNGDYMGLRTNGTERLRIDSSGRLLVGTSSDLSGGDADARLQVNGDAGAQILLSRQDFGALTAGTLIGEVVFRSQASGVKETSALIKCEADATQGSGDKPGRLVFSTTADGASSPTERMRISNYGILYTFLTGNIGNYFATSVAAGTTGTVLRVAHSATQNAINGTVSFQVFSNGNVQNTNNSYGALSDIKLKENIVDASSQWDDLKAIQVRNYNLKEGQTHTQIGLIAQEVEPISPGLVYESPDRDEDGNDLGTVTKSVNYSVLYMKAVKALQEAMERIETLEQRLTDAGL
jgi:hypothetical protein